MDAFVFPGQGSQYVGMGKDLAENFNSAKLIFEEANDALGFDVKSLCFSGSESDLRLTANTQQPVLQRYGSCRMSQISPPLLLPAILLVNIQLWFVVEHSLLPMPFERFVNEGPSCRRLSRLGLVQWRPLWESM